MLKQHYAYGVPIECLWVPIGVRPNSLFRAPCFAFRFSSRRFSSRFVFRRVVRRVSLRGCRFVVTTHWKTSERVTSNSKAHTCRCGAGWPTLLKSIHNRTVDSLDNFVDPPLFGPLRSSLTTTRKRLGYSANHESRCDCAEVHLGFLWLQREATSRAAQKKCSVSCCVPPQPSALFWLFLCFVLCPPSARSVLAPMGISHRCQVTL